jgi:hypothetical integral membrane protein (TIGR02206 family)
VFDYFWYWQQRPIPDGVAFGLFSAAHLIALALLGVFVVAIPVAVYKRLDADGRRKMRLTVGIITLLLDLVVQIAYAVGGAYTPGRIPWHLCSMGVWMVLFDSIRPNVVCREVLYSLTTWSAVCAAVFPDWADRPIMNIFSWQSFASHGFLLAYPLMILVAGEFRPNWRNLWKVALVLAGWVAVALVINHYLDTNFVFLGTAAPGSPMEPIQAFSGSFYIPFLAFLLYLVWTAFYAPWIIKQWWRERHPLSSQLVAA